MTQNQADILKQELQIELRDYFPDISVNFDIFEEQELLVINLFWDRITSQNWSNSKRFNCPIKEYSNFLKNELIPYMEKQQK